MESTVFKKMHLEEGAKGIALYAPPEFHAMAAGQELVAFPSRGPYDFVVLFATNLNEDRARAGGADRPRPRRLLGARLLQARDGEAVAAADTAAGRGASP